MNIHTEFLVCQPALSVIFSLSFVEATGVSEDQERLLSNRHELHPSLYEAHEDLQ